MTVRLPRRNRVLGLLRWSAIAVCVAVAGPRVAASSEDVHAAQRARFVAALAAVREGPQPVERADDGSLKEYPLYPYLQAERLRHALAAASGANDIVDEQVRQFLATHADLPVATAVRRDWLRSLGKRGQWQGLVQALPDPTSVEGEVGCLALTARIETDQTTDLAPLIVQRWLSADQQPAECERPFAWLRESGLLDAGLVEQRVRLILGKGNARFARLIARELPDERAQPLLAWAALLEQPRHEIDALIAAPSRPVEAAALLAGWTKLVASDREYARQRYRALVDARGLDRDRSGPLALALALRLAWNRDPQALDYFAAANAADFDDTAHEWHARAALWQGDWPRVTAAIAAMPTALAQTPRWRYWAGRAAQRQGDDVAANAYFSSVLPTDNYFAAMAAAHLERPFTPTVEPVPADDRELERLASAAAFVRARELERVARRNEALREWQYGLRQLPEMARAQAVHLGMRWQWYDTAIATATQLGIFDDYALLYPRPYDSDVAAAASRTGLPAELVYGVMRQESLFRRDARSSAGAVGLLQMLPETARATARRARLPVPRPADLLTSAVSVRLGTTHLKELIDRFGGHVPLALAGYNAGPNAAIRWLPDDALDTDVWIENIPFNETRTYVQRILWHSLVFSWLRTGRPQDTRHWLTQTSRAGAAPASILACEPPRRGEVVGPPPVQCSLARPEAATARTLSTVPR